MSIFKRFSRTDSDEAKWETIEGIPFEVMRISGDRAVSKALDSRDAWRGKFTPVILGSGEDLNLLSENFEPSDLPPEDALQASKRLNLTQWFEERLQQTIEDVEGADVFARYSNPDHWQLDAGPLEINSVKELSSRKFRREVWIAKVPTAKPFETPAYLRIGGWNECPDSIEHVAKWREWEQHYGAEILCITHDVIEATVKHPPSKKEECYRLAKEQFLYCSDIVTQGVESIDALAATLRNGKYWYFWWD